MSAIAAVLVACQRHADEVTTEQTSPELSAQRCREAFSQGNRVTNEVAIQLPGSHPRIAALEQPYMQRCMAITPEAQRCLVGSYAAAHGNCSQYSREMATVTRK